MKREIIYTVPFWLLALILSFVYDSQISYFIASSRIWFLNSFMGWLSSMFTGFTILLIVTTLFLWEERKRVWIMPLWASFLLTGIAILALKYVTGRARPFAALGLPLMENVSYTFRLWDTSFPSFHAAAAFCTIAILSREFPKLRIFWIMVALLIAFSRLYIGVHYLSDILGGALIGYLVGLAIVFVEEKHKIFKGAIEKAKRAWH